MEKKDVPAVLYRFRPMSQDHDFHAIDESYLYFSRVDRFNDPFEFKVNHDIDIPDPLDDWDAFSRFNKQYMKLTTDQLKRLIVRGELDRYVNDKRDEWRSWIHEDLMVVFQDTVYCCCLNRNPMQPLMWGHYADGLKGLALGYSTEHLSESYNDNVDDLFRDVTYPKDDKLPFLLYDPLLYSQDDSEAVAKLHKQMFQDMFCTKSYHWEYEEEVRILWQESKDWNGHNHYAPNSLVEVIFGELMPESKRKKVCELLKGREIQFKEAVRSDSHHKILIRDI